MGRLLFLFITFVIFGIQPLASLAVTDSEKNVRAREIMVQNQLTKRGIVDKRVLMAMSKLPRHLFVPKILALKAYSDSPLPIGEGQTISQPYIVALMTEVLELTGSERVLEIGTGSGYQAAVLSEVAKEVISIEIKEKLCTKASKLLDSLGYTNVKVRCGDGYFGWNKGAPYDAIMLTAAVDHIPPPLLAQLTDGGRLVLPLGNPFSYQNLVLVTKKGGDYTVWQIAGVLFVPMTGHAMKASGKK
ncbi:protein-L-isoaspartate(D-aspartate) O-methyltransferase [Photobacterium sp. SDRW27]|uniref:protein-L-isoaspartate(D-aspartate) O-methyltransferase n=1 Tax=Photobacterium obscurum TaxID=2829490 RepID=UPI002243DA61|nr:protein-L-isoaspartate(D-aspartate) O-methyltransferase [Photobacterium obscurum]MCW8327850.1 protein-L-isoaspartate(D-aspartate) O-methyltransferase [Photobacterium obscurum]